MEFSPSNKVVRLCLHAIALEDKGQAAEASRLFAQAWDESTHDFEKFMAAYFRSRVQEIAGGKMRWLETALQFALKIGDDSVKSALPSIYRGIADCHEQLGSSARAQEDRALAASVDETPVDKGPFFHGTKADLRVGDLLTPGGASNYEADLKMNHIYFTALAHGAGLAAALAKGKRAERVYVVEPTGPFENDPNVTNMKFPGNPTRSYRSSAPLKIVGEVVDWKRQTPEELEQWRARLAKSTGKIIN